MTNQEKAEQLLKWRGYLADTALSILPTGRALIAYLEAEASRLTTAPVADNELREAIARVRADVESAQAWDGTEYKPQWRTRLSCRDVTTILTAAEKSLDHGEVRRDALDEALARAEERAAKWRELATDFEDVSRGGCCDALTCTCVDELQRQFAALMSTEATQDSARVRRPCNKGCSDFAHPEHDDSTEATPDTEEKG